jgi:phage/plasmid primase-like uncharacterized protein
MTEQILLVATRVANTNVAVILEVNECSYCDGVGRFQAHDVDGEWHECLCPCCFGDGLDVSVAAAVVGGEPTAEYQRSLGSQLPVRLTRDDGGTRSYMLSGHRLSALLEGRKSQC